jgi:hypothetical protein
VVGKSLEASPVSLAGRAKLDGSDRQLVAIPKRSKAAKYTPNGLP